MRVNANVLVALVALIQNGSVAAASNSNGKLRTSNTHERGLSSIPSSCQSAEDDAFNCASSGCKDCITEGFNQVHGETCVNYESKLVVFITSCGCSSCYDQFSKYFGCVRPECGPFDGDFTDSGGTYDWWCFSGFNTVHVQEKGVVPMRELEIGDNVLTANGKFSRVYSFGHNDRDAEIEFLQIQTKGLETPLEISHNHMMFVGDRKLARAADVRVGDMLGEHPVTAIRTVKRRGVYAPLTETGELVVSGASASSYVVFFDYSPRLQHWVSHAIGSPFRLVCAFNFGICKNETYSEGLSNYYVAFIKLANKISLYPKTVQLGVTLIAAPMMASAFVLEKTILSPLLCISALVLGYMMVKKDYNGKKIRDEGCVVSS